MAERQYVLVAVETAGIQSYIFASNRLKENVGASYLVAAATGDWAFDAVRSLGVRHNLTGDDEQPYSDARVEDSDVDVEVLYSGGGNIILLFAETGFDATDFGDSKLPQGTISRAFISTLSRRVLFYAPGLQLTFATTVFTWDSALSQAVGDLLAEMKAQRSQQPPLRGDAGQGVTIMGASTSMPAVTMQRDPEGNWQPLAAETVAKRAASVEANRVLRRTLALGATDYRLPLELDDLGRSKDESSYIAVVHADGNGLGVFIQGLKDDYPANKNRDYIDYMRAFSENVKRVAQAAQRDMVAQLLASIEDRGDERRLTGLRSDADAITLKRNDSEGGQRRYVLPLRPLVSGGDDVTFVCDGRIGFDLVVTFLQAFERHSAAILGRKLTACAGLAIVKTHYPFARAYELADDLAGSAKQARHDYDKDQAPSALDWHITAGGLYGDLDAMREREYKVTEGSLTLRPLFMGDVPDALQPRSWQVMSNIITEFQTKWREHRNKAEGLRSALRKGSVETAVFRARYLTASRADWSAGQAPYLPEVAGFEDNGWRDGVCGYYDALELLDKYIPLQSITEEATPA